VPCRVGSAPVFRHQNRTDLLDNRSIHSVCFCGGGVCGGGTPGSPLRRDISDMSSGFGAFFSPPKPNRPHRQQKHTFGVCVGGGGGGGGVPSPTRPLAH